MRRLTFKLRNVPMELPAHACAPQYFLLIPTMLLCYNQYIKTTRESEDTINVMSEKVSEIMSELNRQRLDKKEEVLQILRCTHRKRKPPLPVLFWYCFFQNRNKRNMNSSQNPEKRMVMRLFGTIFCAPVLFRFCFFQEVKNRLHHAPQNRRCD